MLTANNKRRAPRTTRNWESAVHRRLFLAPKESSGFVTCELRFIVTGTS